MKSADPLDNLSPWMLSPAALAMEDRGGKFKLPRHLEFLNNELVNVAAGVTRRLMVNMPFQHGKTTLCSNYFPAWWLMLAPDLRFLLSAHETTFAAKQGGTVRDIVDRWGPLLGVNLKGDSKAKAEWVVEGSGGGMVCRGMTGSLNGRPADAFIIEDPIRDAIQAMSPAMMDQHWDWYCTLVDGRLSKNAPIVVVTTRWGKNDLCGRILESAEKTGEEWRVVKFKAIAEEDDILGRKPGEALWPEEKPLEALLRTKKRSPRWFRICWQQEGGEGAGSWFKPRNPEGQWLWPTYKSLGNGAWSCVLPDGRGRKIWSRQEMLILVTVDWAYSKKRTADYTAMGVFGLTPKGELLVLDIVNDRFGVSELAPAMAALCGAWEPHLVAVEGGHPTLRDEYRRFTEIPEVRWLTTKSKQKLQRSLQAITMGEQNKIFLPSDDAPWLENYVCQLLDFTGMDDAHEDMVDVTAYAGMLALEMRGRSLARGSGEPIVLTAGRGDW